MPKLYPETIDHLDQRFAAEKQVFDILKSLDDACHIFHSLTWCDDREGECDFIIFHELKGYIALEVKGGRINYDGYSWTSTDGDGVTHDIHDPVKQARESMYAVKKTWDDRYDKPLPGLFTWGVCFFDGAWDPAFRTLDLTAEKVLDAGAMQDVQAWVDGLFARQEARHGARILAKADAEQFISIFKKDFSVPLSLNRAIIRQEEELAMTTKMQDYLLDLFDDKARIGFQGAAGTGKTWIAMNKARRLAAEGRSVLFLCYNRQVNDFIAGQLNDEDNITVKTFHGFANGIIREYLAENLKEDGCRQCFFTCISDIAETAFPGKKDKKFKGDGSADSNSIDQKINGALHLLSTVPKQTACGDVFADHESNLPEAVRNVMHFLMPLDQENQGDYFADRIPLALMSILESDPALAERYHYDALIIDEAQDFHKNWCDSLERLFLNYAERICYIFYDDNQTIFKRDEELPVTGLIASAGLEDHIFKLRDNLRNTARIHDFAVAKTGRGGTSRSLEIPGIEPVETAVKGSVEARKAVGNILHNLVEVHSISTDRIVVLSNRSFGNSVFGDDKKIGNYTLVDQGKGARKNAVRFRTIQQFKGLEADVVILVDHRRDVDKGARYHSEELFYVGYSRAKHLLYVVEVG